MNTLAKAVYEVHTNGFRLLLAALLKVRGELAYRAWVGDVAGSELDPQDQGLLLDLGRQLVEGA